MRYRLRLFVRHLVVSLIMGLLSAVLVYGVWYPGVLSKAIGVSSIFLMMLTIDVIVGPLFTLLLAKQGKKSLVFDLSVVVCIQVAAWLYGMAHIAEGRPVWLVLNVYRVEAIQADDTDYQSAQPPFNRDSWLGPQWAWVRLPKDEVERSTWLMTELEGGKAPSKRANLFRSLQDNWNSFVREIQPLTKLNKFNSAQQVANTLASYPQADGFLPLRAPSVDMTVLVSRQQQEIVAIVDLRPWQ